MNRQQRRELDRQVRQSIQMIQANLEFLNAAGNPKYKLVVERPAMYHTKKLIKKLKFWS